MEIKEFFTYVTGLTPTPEQAKFLEDAVNLNEHKLLISAGRQSGKTLCSAVVVLWFIFEYPEPLKILLISAQQNILYLHILNIFRRMKDVDGRFRNVKDGGVILEDTPWNVVPLRGFTTTKGTLVYVRGSTDKQIRGLPADVVVIDECCVLPDTDIIGNNNIVNIKDNPNKVVTEDGSIQETIKFFERDYEGEVYKIIPYNNNIGVTLTPEHPIKVIRREKYVGRKLPKGIHKKPEWIKAKDVNEHDVLVFPIPHREIKDINISKERLKLIGYYISEGSVGDHQIFFSNANETIINEIKECIRKEFGVEAGTTRLRGVTNIYFTNKEFREWLIANCGKGCRNKQIPDILMTLPYNKLSIMFDTMFKGDGCYRQKMKQVEYTSMSKKLVEQLWFIHSSEGKICGIRERSSYNSNYKEEKVYDFFIRRKNRRSQIKRGYFYTSIRKIVKSYYKGKVYNLAVNNKQSYLVPFITLHNCEVKNDVILTALGNLSGKISKLILISTPHVSNSLFVEWATEENSSFKVFTWSSENLSWHSKEILEEKKKRMSKEKYAVEVLGRPPTKEERAFFPSKHIDQCVKEVEAIREGGQLSRLEIGIDCGFTLTYLVVTERLGSTRRKIIYRDSWGKRPIEEIGTEILDLINKFNPYITKIDSKPEEYKRWFSLHAKYKVTFVDFAIHKEQMMGQLQRLIREHRIIIPQGFPDIIVALRKYRYRKGQEAKTTGSDIVEALALSCYEPTEPLSGASYGMVYIPQEE